MPTLLRELLELDLRLTEATGELRWAPLTPIFALASEWWVRTLVFVVVGFVRDVVARAAPLCAPAGAVAILMGSVATKTLKGVFDRARPPLVDPQIDPLVGLPGSPSFPSGHAVTAFAAASAVGVLAPRLRWPLLALAALVAFSRVYLGVHFWLDVVAGAALGAALGTGVALGARRIPRLARVRPAAD